MYVIGKTGMGKTTMLENMIIADIRAGRGVGIVDPHGELAEKILAFIPEERIRDVIYFNPKDLEFPIAFNPLEQVNTEFRHLVASGIMGVFKKIWPDVWSARMEYILNNSLLALLEYPGSTILGVMRLLSDKEYRKKVVDNLKDPVVKSFWVNEFAKYTQRLESEATASIQNKIGQFVTNPLIRNILGQQHSSIDMRKVMDERKILIVNLSKGKIGEDNSALLGAMIITKIQLAAMSRVEMAESERLDFYLYVDEFQNFATDSFANILSEARKYRLCLVLAHQYIGQLINGENHRVRDAIFGNVGTIVSFRIGAEDAEFLEKEFEPDFMVTDFVNLPKYNFYLKLMIDGISSRPFSATTITPEQLLVDNFKNEIIENSRQNYTTPKSIVEEKIATEWVTGETEKKQEKTEWPRDWPKGQWKEESSRPAQSGPVQPGPARPGREEWPRSGSGSNRPPGQREQSLSDVLRPRFDRLPGQGQGPARPGPDRPGSDRPPSRYTSVQGQGPPPRWPTQPGPTQSGPARPGPTQSGPTQSGPTQPGPTQPGPARPPGHEEMQGPPAWPKPIRPASPELQQGERGEGPPHRDESRLGPPPRLSSQDFSGRELRLDRLPDQGPPGQGLPGQGQSPPSRPTGLGPPPPPARSFSQEPRPDRPQSKKVDIADLRKSLEEALNKSEPENPSEEKKNN